MVNPTNNKSILQNKKQYKKKNRNPNKNKIK